MRAVTPVHDDIDWIHRCESVSDLHMHLGQYLIEGPEGYVLIDAGEGEGEELVDTIRNRTDGQGLEAVILTHSILPHTANLDAIVDAWDGTTVFSCVPNPAAVGLPDAEPSFSDEMESVGGGTFSFVDPLVTDVVVSSWIYHHESKTMFTSEGLGHYHAPGECDMLSLDYEEGLPREYVAQFARNNLGSLEYVDPGKLEIAFENFLTEFEVERFAPTHGAPIETPDFDTYMETLVRVATDMEYDPGRTAVSSR